MTNIKRVREITIEVEKVRVVSNLKKQKVFCDICSFITDFITLNSASQVFQITEEFIAQLARENSVHIKFENEEILICLKSLMDAKEEF